MSRASELPSLLDVNLDLAPWITIWEVTRACDLACRHCRADAQPLRHPQQLTTDEGFQLLDQIAALKSPIFVFTGGDPLKRPDLFELIAYARKQGITPAVTPSPTPTLTAAAIREMKQAGVARMALSLDGATAETHDSFRGVRGSFDIVMAAAREAVAQGISLQINTSLSRHNLEELEQIAELVAQLDATLWSVFFVIPTGRGQQRDIVTAEEAEAVFHRLYALSLRLGIHIKTTEAMHYRRFLLQQRVQRRQEGLPAIEPPRNIPRGINDGSGFVFISHIGDVYPSGFLPISAGNIRQRPLAELYRDSALFRTIRDRSMLKGKCGRCEFRHVCGGSRARSFALTGDWLAADPGCVYQPGGDAMSVEV